MGYLGISVCSSVFEVGVSHHAIIVELTIASFDALKDYFDSFCLAWLSV